MSPLHSGLNPYVEPTERSNSTDPTWNNHSSTPITLLGLLATLFKLSTIAWTKIGDYYTHSREKSELNKDMHGCQHTDPEAPYPCMYHNKNNRH